MRNPEKSFESALSSMLDYYVGECEDREGFISDFLIYFRPYLSKDSMAELAETIGEDVATMRQAD